MVMQEVLRGLFEAAGFSCDELRVRELRLENRARELAMDRRWVQAAFTLRHQPCAAHTCLLSFTTNELSPMLLGSHIAAAK